jgi:hypothetical protein
MCSNEQQALEVEAAPPVTPQAVTTGYWLMIQLLHRARGRGVVTFFSAVAIFKVFFHLQLQLQRGY